MRTFTATDGTWIRRDDAAYEIRTDRAGITVERARLQHAWQHDEFMLALSLALDDLKKIRCGGRLKPRKTPPADSGWPNLEHK